MSTSKIKKIRKFMGAQAPAKMMPTPSPQQSLEFLSGKISETAMTEDSPKSTQASCNLATETTPTSRVIPSSQSSSETSDIPSLRKLRSDATRRQHAISYLMRSVAGLKGRLKSATYNATSYLRSTELSITDDRVVEMKESLAEVDELLHRVDQLMRQLSHLNEVTKLLNAADREAAKEAKKEARKQERVEALAAKRRILQQDQK